VFPVLRDIEVYNNFPSMNTALWGFPQGSYWRTMLKFIKIKQHQVKNSILCWHFY